MRMEKEENKSPRQLKLGNLIDTEEKMNAELHDSQHKKGNIMSV